MTLYVHNQNEHDPALNLALEEFVLQRTSLSLNTLSK